jgi:hypothetical protein
MKENDKLKLCDQLFVVQVTRLRAISISPTDFEAIKALVLKRK